jgi:hypothetical protein
MSNPSLRTVLSFSVDDQAWLRRGQIAVPNFFQGHDVAPAQGDVLRIAGRQFVVQGRVWEHDSEGPLLRLFMGHAHAQSDTIFG